MTTDAEQARDMAYALAKWIASDRPLTDPPILTPRERFVLEHRWLMRKARTAVAAELDTSIHRVRQLEYRAFDKLGLTYARPPEYADQIRAALGICT